MKLYNTRFRSEEKLDAFLGDHHLHDDPRLLIQIFAYRQAKPSTLAKVTDLLRRKLPRATIVGCSAEGEILEGRVLEKNIVLSFALFEKSEIASAFIPCTSQEQPDLKPLKTALLKPDTKALLIYCSDRTHNIEAIVQELRGTQTQIVAAGALAAGDTRGGSGIVLHQERISERGLVAVSLSGDALIAHSAYRFDFTPIGRTFKVTKASNHILYTIEKSSLRNLYSKYLVEEIADTLPYSGLQFPLVEEREGCYLPKTPLIDRGDGSFGFGSAIEEGASLSIAFADIDRMRAHIPSIIEELCKRPIEGLFIYDSIARKHFLEALAYEDVLPFKEIAPHAGCFKHAEFITDNQQIRLFSQSLSLLALSEDADAQVTPPKIAERSLPKNVNLQTIKALSNIAKVSSFELQELNAKLEQRIREEVEKNRKKEGILIHNSRLAQMGEMMSMIAHQWRQPLSAISATSTGLQVKIELENYDEAFFLDALQKIEEYVLYLSHTIDDFANFFKPNKKKEWVAPRALIEKALFIISPALKKHSIMVRKEIETERAVETISNEVVQVLLNLIKNAQNALVKNRILEPTIIVRAYEKGERTVLEVEDNAGGIPAEHMQKIFEPYFSTKQHEKSTGLGLYMSKFIIEESCGGRLEVVNTAKGAKFTITL